MTYYLSDFEKQFETEGDLFAWLENHYAGDTDFDSLKEFDVLEAGKFDEDMEPVGACVTHTVVIEPVMKWTARDDERGEDYGVPTGRHNVYWE